jgi:hypothetical protein
MQRLASNPAGVSPPTLISPISGVNQALIAGNAQATIQFKYYEIGPNGISLIGNQAPVGTVPTGNSSTGLALNSGLIQYSSYGTSPGANTYSSNEWHDVRVELNFNAQTYTTFIDDVQDTFTPAPMVNFNQSTLTNVWMGNFAAVANWYLDDFQVTTTGPAPSSEREWNVTGTGAFTNYANWSPKFVPNAVDQKALFGPKISAASTVIIDSALTLNGMTFNNANKYALSGTGSITLAGASPIVTVTTGTHEIQVPVILASNAVVNATGGVLDFNNQIDLAGKTLTTNGTVHINGGVINSTGAGTGMLVNDGTLSSEGQSSIAGDFVNHGTLAVALAQGASDLFNVLGSADLSGAISVDFSGAFVPAAKTTILTAADGISLSGPISLVGPDAGWFASISVVGNSLVLTAVPEPAGVSLLFLGALLCCNSRRQFNSIR